MSGLDASIAFSSKPAKLRPVVLRALYDDTATVRLDDEPAQSRPLEGAFDTPEQYTGITPATTSDSIPAIRDHGALLSPSPPDTPAPRPLPRANTGRTQRTAAAERADHTYSTPIPTRRQTSRSAAARAGNHRYRSPGTANPGMSDPAHHPGPRGLAAITVLALARPPAPQNTAADRTPAKRADHPSTGHRPGRTGACRRSCRAPTKPARARATAGT
ncbi:hypothetical protein GCM10010277_86280 [Streptomyces longisporoflavus]|nr:hypothetical protein GCM10010277_86280 [Streptomyces longisporoflavus]